MIFLSLFGPALPQSTATSTQNEVYVEDFTAVTYKAHTASADWDTRAHALRLTPIDHEFQEDEAIAVDSAGNAFVAWADSRNDLDDVYIQRLDANGNRLWPTDVRVNSDEGDAFQGIPTIAVGSDGAAVVAWYDSRAGYAIYAQKIGPDGSRLWPADVRVNSGLETANTPKIALDATGVTAMVTFMRKFCVPMVRRAGPPIGASILMTPRLASPIPASQRMTMAARSLPGRIGATDGVRYSPKGWLETAISCGPLTCR